MDTPVRDWTFEGALKRWQQTAESVLPDHAAVPYVDDDSGCSILCRCGYRGKGLDWLKHLNEALTAAIKD